MPIKALKPVPTQAQVLSGGGVKRKRRSPLLPSVTAEPPIKKPRGRPKAVSKAGVNPKLKVNAKRKAKAGKQKQSNSVAARSDPGRGTHPHNRLLPSTTTTNPTVRIPEPKSSDQTPKGAAVNTATA